MPQCVSEDNILVPIDFVRFVEVSPAVGLSSFHFHGDLTE